MVSGPSREPPAAKIQETTNVINDCVKRCTTSKRSVRLKVKGSAPNLQQNADQLEQAMNKVGDSRNRDRDPQNKGAFVTAAISFGQTINKYMTTFKGDADLATSL